MPLFDYCCPSCLTVLQDQYRSIAEGQKAHPPRCPDCGDPMDAVVPLVAMDVGAVKGAAFQKFDVDVDGRPTTIDSMHTLRKVERESEQRYRNGEGEPMRFRMWNQTASNKDVHTFGDAGKIGERTYDNGQAPTKGGRVGVKRHGEQKPQTPVARHAGQSALKG